MQNWAYIAKHMRGVILANLRSYYPNGLSVRSIYRTIVQPVFPEVDVHLATTQISYLESRGYLDRVNQEGPHKPESVEDLIYRLTATGLDVAMGVTADPAILVEA